MHTSTDCFDRNLTNICKGFALVIMAYFHLFGNLPVDRYNAVIPLVRNVIAPYGNVCVCFFVLLTGYGFAVQNRTEATHYGKTMIRRLVSLYSGFWPVFLIAFVAAPFLAEGRGDWGTAYGAITPFCLVQRAIIDMLGLSYFEYGWSNTICQTWWYVSLALVLILVLPVFCTIWRRLHWKGLVFVSVAAILLPDLRFLAYFPAAMLGVCLAGSNGFEIIHQKKRGPIGVVLRLAMLLAVAVVWYSIRKYNYCIRFADTIIAWVSCQLCFDVLQYIPPVRGLLLLLGKHSANCFFVHSLLCYYWISVANSLLLLRYDLLILTALLGLSVVFSLILERIKQLVGWQRIMKKTEYGLLMLFREEAKQ